MTFWLEQFKRRTAVGSCPSSSLTRVPRLSLPRAGSFLQLNLMVFAAFKGKNPAGLLTYRIKGPDCEIVTIDSTSEGEGIGTSLIDAVKGRARTKGCRRLWLITTNDNLSALGFYQRRGFRFSALYPNALEASRKLKPQIPMKAANGIPIRDELELELELSRQLDGRNGLLRTRQSSGP